MAINKTFEINLDMKQEVANDPIMVVEGDNGNVFVITLTDDGEPVDLTGCRVLAVFSKSTKQTVEQDTDGSGVTVGGENSNVITIDVRNTSFAPGTTNCELQVYSGENRGVLVTSAKFNFLCRPSIMNDDTIQAAEEYPVLLAVIESAEAATEAANAAAVATGELIAEAQELFSGIWSGTQMQYDALSSYDDNVLYFILRGDGA